MSSYQDVVLVAQSDAQTFELDVRLIHADAFLPLPTDKPTLLAMLLDGARRGAIELAPRVVADDDSALLAAGDGVIDAATLLAAPSRDKARYRIQLRAGYALVPKHKKCGWSAAAGVWLPGVAHGSVPRELLVTTRALPSSERIARLTQIALTQPQNLGAAALALGGYHARAQATAAALSRHLYALEYEIATALGMMGNDVAVGPLVLAAWRSETKSEWMFRALAWLGPSAKSLAEPLLLDAKPTLEVLFARWRVLGDASALDALVAMKSGDRHAGPELELTRNEMLCSGPSEAALDVIEQVAPHFVHDDEFEFEAQGARQMAALMTSLDEVAPAKKAPAKKAPAKKAPAKKAPAKKA